MVIITTTTTTFRYCNKIFSVLEDRDKTCVGVKVKLHRFSAPAPYSGSWSSNTPQSQCHQADITCGFAGWWAWDIVVQRKIPVPTCNRSADVLRSLQRHVCLPVERPLKYLCPSFRLYARNNSENGVAVFHEVSCWGVSLKFAVTSRVWSESGDNNRHYT